MDKENSWTTEEVEEMVAILKEREILSLPVGKKSRALDTFKVVADDLRTKGVHRTAEEIRKKLRIMRKNYFKANKSRSKIARRSCKFFPLLHDLFSDAQKKINLREARSETNQKQQKHQPTAATSNYHSRSSAVRSVSASSVSSMQSPHSYQNGYDHHYHQHHSRHKYSASLPFGPNCDVSRRHESPARVISDKYHLKLNEYQPNLNNSLANLCKNDRYADVFLFVCNDVDNIVIPAHRLVLGTFSSYFANIFEKANLLPSQMATSIVLPPMVTRAATQYLLQYMYTGETIVPLEILDEVMLCGELLRIHGFCKKKASSMLSQKGQSELISVPLVSVTKNLSMDPTVVCDLWKRKSVQTPRPSPTPTPTSSRSSTPAPVPRRDKSPQQPIVLEKPSSVTAKEEKVDKLNVKSVTSTLNNLESDREEQKSKPIRTEKGIQTSTDTMDRIEKLSDKNLTNRAEKKLEENAVVSKTTTDHPDTPPSMPPSPSVHPCPPRISPPRSVPPPQLSLTSAPKTVPEPQRSFPKKTRTPPRDIIDELDNMVTLTSDESMMEIVTKSPESRNSPFSTHTNSPISPNESRSKLEALIEFDYDELNLPNTSMDDQPCVDLHNEDDHQEGTPLDQLVCSRLNCQLCYESFTTPTDWVQHVSGHCIMDQGLLKRRRISSDDGNSLDSAFRCDLCSSYFISAYDWQSHVAEAHEGV